ncbi:MAG: hypothetical protein ACRESR_03525, partial [Gammaproteobacteria bacterium]
GNDCPSLAELGDGELTALNWTAAQLAFAHARETPGARVLAWNFDDFLAHPRTRLDELARHFGLVADRKMLDAALATPWLGRYAKDPSQTFSVAQRRHELAAAARQYASEIRRGLDFARRLRPQLPLDKASTQPD